MHGYFRKVNEIVQRTKRNCYVCRSLESTEGSICFLVQYAYDKRNIWRWLYPLMTFLMRCASSSDMGAGSTRFDEGKSSLLAAGASPDDISEC